MAPLTPDHHFYIDQGANAHVRLVLHRGRPEARRGRPARPARRRDVPALQRAARASSASADAIDARAIVAGRRAEREAAARAPSARLGRHGDAVAARVPVPRQLGLPGPLPPDASPTTRRIITGIAGSPGVVEGIARVVRTVDEFDEVRDGDILVCQMTNPAWVVLFTKIAGLVTDTGGTTSHPAVLAREFGIPAVIGTSVATQRIATGDRIRVDGTAGRVEILRGEPAEAAARPGVRDRALRAAAWPSPESISRSVLADQVKDRILEDILNGHHPPDSRIIETQVARELGTSQAPVREALRGLEALGVVEITPFRGARVRRPSRREILEAYAVRSTLESLGGPAGRAAHDRRRPRRARRPPRGDASGGPRGRRPRPGRGRCALPRADRRARRQRHAREGLALARAVLADLSHPGRSPAPTRSGRPTSMPRSSRRSSAATPTRSSTALAAALRRGQRRTWRAAGRTTDRRPSSIIREREGAHERHPPAVRGVLGRAGAAPDRRARHGAAEPRPRRHELPGLPAGRRPDRARGDPRRARHRLAARTIRKASPTTAAG